ncbi:hypothetical protein ACQY1M_25150 (plasmid) [Neorhizobium sp. DAR64861/K0K2]|uniref:hypothetical protein n=1 Tax=Neorhizobium sp. DAR64861/K0K2 TaxID=3421956 RepID=UPI003D2E1337
MPSIHVELSAEELASLEEVASSFGQTTDDFVAGAVRAAVLNADPEKQGPISRIRSKGYPRAMGPFEIIEAPVETVLGRPRDLTQTELKQLQKNGVALINVRFREDGAVREPDFAIKELLG